MAISLIKFFKRGSNGEMRRKDRRTLDAMMRKHRSREFQAGMILMNAYLASAYWTFLGHMKTAEETATASFTGSLHALIAAIVSAVVVAGCCAMLLAFSGSGDANE